MNRTRNEYLIGAAIVWAAIWVATASVVDDHAFNDMIPILGGGTVFFVVLVPVALFRHRH